MYLAIIADDSLPRSTLVHAKMLNELALELMRRGHNVVIIAPGRSKQAERLNDSVISGVTYWKFKSDKLRGKGKIKRAINETLLSLKAWIAIKENITEEPFDGVIYYSPSIFFGPLVNKIKRQCKCKSYLILRDMFPQWAVDEGIIKSGSLIEKYFRYFENVNYHAADAIGLMSPKNLNFFLGQRKENFNAHVLYNWADMDAFVEKTDTANIRDTYNLHGKVIFFYGGNIGHAQDMGNLLRLAKSMKEVSNAHFIFLGQGDEVDLVNQTIKSEELINATFLASVSQERYKQILTQVDIGLFSLAASHKTHNFPGKLLGYMHASLPVLGSVNKGNDLNQVIIDAGAGFIFTNGQDHEFFEAAKVLASNVEKRKELGSNANRLLATQFSLKSAADIILDSLS